MSDFTFTKLDLKGAFLIDYFSVGDIRGGFAKSFEKDIYEEAGIKFNLNETFISVSSQNVIRGLHFQLHKPQAKLVSVPKGKVYDVIVDLRCTSSTYKKWRGYELSAENHQALYVPRGFAHGFLSLEDGTIMMYQCDGAYDKASDTGIRFDDPDIGVTWPVEESCTIHSKRDLALLSFKDFENLAKINGFR